MSDELEEAKRWIKIYETKMLIIADHYGNGKANIKFVGNPSGMPPEIIRQELKRDKWRYGFRQGLWFPSTPDGSFEFAQQLKNKYFED